MGKHIDLGIEGIKCDADGCGYEDTFGPWGQTKEEILEMNEKMIGKPCPLCGANLLTEADAKMVVAMLEMADLMEDLSETLCEEFPELATESDEKITVRLEMDGSGDIKLK